jgi:hypothetical protein
MVEGHLELLRMPRIPQRPQNVTDLDLMQRLAAYSHGTATWHDSNQPLGLHEQTVCGELHANLASLIQKCLHPLMDRITSREMQGFTMHDSGHGLKVAHLMWHIMLPSRRQQLNPGEIALILTAAHFHDLGMGLSEEERKARLSSNSDLWERLDPQSFYSTAITGLEDAAKKGLSDPAKNEALFQVQQAQEALLCADTRDRHAKRERYLEIIRTLEVMHASDPINIPNIHTLLSFDGDSYEDKLLDICVSHNQDAHVLLDRDPTNADQWRFPVHYPIGISVADTRLVAAALRLADILDFDRERTPPVLFHYLLPRSATPSENVSVREWSKHLSISNWEIDAEKIIFRGRSPSAFIHHTIVEFCHAIEEEIARTLSVFDTKDWPFLIKPRVEAAIEATGYRYVPYRFSLDEERIYQLLMGRSIYPDSLDALRELIQNAVDACKLRDALMRFYDKSVTPTKESRIIVEYEERGITEGSAVLTVTDTGIGMDKYIIENYFLKVGRSYYRSSDFLQTRSLLRKDDLDFSPVSEFGIGFMAVFMLGDRVEVETSASYPTRNDVQRRLLRIDGQGRLIEVTEDQNISAPRFQGTRVSIRLASRAARYQVPTWTRVESYLRTICKNVPYPIHLRHVTVSEVTESIIVAEGLQVPIPEHLRSAALTIAIDDAEAGIAGEVVLFREAKSRAAEAALAAQQPIIDAESFPSSQLLIRGGFVIGRIASLPRYLATPAAHARVEVTWQNSKGRFLPSTDIGRSRLADVSRIEQAILKTWITYLLRNIRDIERDPLGTPELYASLFEDAKWLEQHDAYTVYRLGRTCWIHQQTNRVRDFDRRVATWEKSQGGPLYLGWPHSTLHRLVFDLLFPHVTQLMVGREGAFYAAPPKRGWKGKLHRLNDFITNRRRWGPFAEYIGNISPLLYDRYSGNEWLNKRHAERFGTFQEDELQKLRQVLDSCTFAKEFRQPALLSRMQSELLNRAIEVAGDLRVADLSHVYRVRDFGLNAN